MNTRPFKSIGLLILLLSLLSACSSATRSTPRPVALATYPRVTPIAIYPAHPDGIVRISIDLLVDDVSQASADAISLAAESGGYLAGQSPWKVADTHLLVIDLAIPQRSYDNFHRQLIKLGEVFSETSWQEPRPGSPIDPTRYLLLTLTLRQDGYHPLPVDSGWNPGHTLEQAWQVFVSIFSFLVDILIWIVVVVGPFAALAALIYFTVRRLRK